MFRCVRGEGEVWADRTFLHCPTDNDGSITGSLMKQSLGRRDDKPRTMVASRHGAGRPGGREEREPGGVGARAVAAKHRVLPPCGTRGAHGRGRTGKGAGCHAAHRASARRRDGDIAPYRHAAREGRTQRDRGTGHGRCARQRDRTTGHGRCARDMTAPRGTGEGARDAHGKWTARRTAI